MHQHVPEELQESGRAGTRRERILEVLAIVLLSAAAIGTAWSGYQAARWSGREAHNFALAEGTHAKSTREVVSGGEARVQDLADFERWLDLETTGDQTLASLHAAHFQGALRSAFDAWLEQDLLNNPNAIPTPLKMPQYHQAEAERAAQLETRDAEAEDQRDEQSDDRHESGVLAELDGDDSPEPLHGALSPLPEARDRQYSYDEVALRRLTTGSAAG